MFNFFPFKPMVVLLMSFLMVHTPHVALSKAGSTMISTQELVDQMSRDEAEAKVIAQLDREEVQAELQKYGVTSEFAKSRLASLSDSELQRIAGEMESGKYGGVVEILVVVVLVLLIIYLARRV